MVVKALAVHAAGLAQLAHADFGKRPRGQQLFQRVGHCLLGAVGVWHGKTLLSCLGCSIFSFYHKRLRVLNPAGALFERGGGFHPKKAPQTARGPAGKPARKLA